MSFASAIREAMTAPNLTAPVIRESAGIAKRQFTHAMWQMVKAGIVTVDRSVWPRTYTLVREPMTRQEALMVAWAPKMAANGGRLLTERERMDRRNARARAKRAAKPRVERPAKPAKPRRAVERTCVAMDVRTLRQAPVIERIETLDEFKARGGVVQTLNPWDVSEHNRLKGRYAS